MVEAVQWAHSKPRLFVQSDYCWMLHVVLVVSNMAALFVRERLPGAMGQATTLLTLAEDGSAQIDSQLDLFTGALDELIDAIGDLIAGGDAHLVVTPNVDQILQLNRSPAARQAVEAASLRLVDGMPLVGLLRLLGVRSVHRHTGADLLPMAARLSQEKAWSIALVGGMEGVAEAAVQRLRAEHPGTMIEAVDLPMLTGPQDPAGKAAVLRLTELQPSLVFLCMGFPRQESWFLHWRELLPSGVYLGTGAAVDFAAGTKRRAPKLMQNLGFEWVYRLWQEPKRLAHRYLVTGPRFVLVAAFSAKARLRVALGR